MSETFCSRGVFYLIPHESRAGFYPFSFINFICRLQAQNTFFRCLPALVRPDLTLCPRCNSSLLSTHDLGLVHLWQGRRRASWRGGVSARHQQPAAFFTCRQATCLILRDYKSEKTHFLPPLSSSCSSESVDTTSPWSCREPVRTSGSGPVPPSVEAFTLL